jgi:outer membrane protein
MKYSFFKAWFLLCIIFKGGFFTSSQAFGLTLEESFESALKSNIGDQLHLSRFNQSLEQQKQNEGNYFPKLALKGTYLKQDKVNTDQKAIGLNLTHSIYKGGRDTILIETSQQNAVIAKNQMSVDRITLYLNVISAYYNYFLYLNDYKNLELLKKQSKERVDETRKRVQVGRSRKGELLQTEAQMATVEAQVLNGRGLVRESEERFYLLTGLDKSNIEFNESIVVPTVVKPLQSYLTAAHSRFDMINFEKKIELADLEIKSTKALNYPTLDLATNYYFNKRNSSTYKNSQWDIGLTFILPLFEGGSTQSKISESVLKKEQAVYSMTDYKKTLEIEISSKYETYRRYLDQVKAFDLAFEKALKSYNEAIKDYRLGVISNLDLLSSLNIYLDSLRNSEKTKIQAMMNLKILEASSGVLP